MLLGHIKGKITTSDFSFEAKEETKNFEYVQVYHKVYDYVLCQVVEVTKTNDKTIANCQVIGYKDGPKIKRPRIPFDPQSEVLRAEDEFIAQIINISDNENSAIIGHLEGRNIPVPIDLNKVLTKHVAVLAKSGAGKSYTVGVILEEIAEKGVPMIIIDPHGEYGSLKNPNTNEAEKLQMAKFDVEPKGYNVAEYGDTTLNPSLKPLKLNARWSAQELNHLLPGKLSANQQAILYSALKDMKDVTFDNILYELEAEESPAKFSIISTIEYLRSLSFFSANPTPYSELIRPGQASIINLKGINPDIQEIIVYKICKDLFQLRKQNKVSPFFLIIEEAHNYCPERSFGETKSSKILRDVASEGRKFGMGMCVISQRPARVDKSVLSQCSTQLILKVTNPNDLKSISNSVEGLTAESEKEIKNLSIGTALLTGVTEVPLFVNIRTRRSAHGGHAVDIIGHATKQQSMVDQVQSFEGEEVLPLIKPLTTHKDIEVMSEKPILGIRTILVPAYQFVCREGEDSYKILVEMEKGDLIVDKENFSSKTLPALDKLSARELKILQTLFTSGPLGEQVLVSKIGGVLDLNDDLSKLKFDNYLFQTDSDDWKINDQFLFTRLSKVATYDEIAYESLSYHEKRVSVLSLDDVRENLNKFTTVEDQYECFIVKHDPIFQEE